MIDIPILNRSNLSKEFDLQLELLKMDHINDMDSEMFNDIDWDVFYDLLLHHRTFSFLYPKLKNSTMIPSAIMQRMERIFKYSTFQMMHLSAEMKHIGTLFETNAIRTLFLKGPVLAKELYGDLSLRPSNDLDVMIPIDELEKVEQLVTNEGYVKDDYIRTVLNDWKWRHHHVAYYHPEKQIKLEIHWRLNPGPMKEPSFNELWDRKQASYITNSSIYMLGKEDLTLFLIMHGARHGWSRLRWLLDIHFLLKQGPNPILLKQLFKKYHSNQLAGQTFRLVSELLGSTITNNLIELMENKNVKEIAQSTMFYFENKINLHSDPVPEWVSQYHDKYLFHMKSPFQKFIFCLSFFYPYPEDQDIIPLPKHFHFLYFPLRPFIMIWKKIRVPGSDTAIGG